MNPNYDVDMKVKSHMFKGCGTWSDTQDYQRWNSNINDIFCKYMMTKKEQAYKDFVLGLCVHCLTDYWNDIKIWKKLQSENREAIIKMLSKAMAFDVDGLVNQEDIEQQRNYLLCIQYDVDNVDISKYHFLSASVIEDFIDLAVKEIAETILTWVKTSTNNVQQCSN